MSLIDPYGLLGLKKNEATLKSAKIAYSKKLKVTRPDDDPEGFIALREAYTSVKNELQWAQDNQQDLATEPALPEEDDHRAGQPEQDIKFWYDKKLDFHFNSSPSGKLIEKTIRWIKIEQAAAPDTFFDWLCSLGEYSDPETAKTYVDFLHGRIFYDAGGDDDFLYDHDVFYEQTEFERPDWLSDEVILAIHHQFGFLGRTPENEWDARHLNCIKTLFEPVLIKNGELVEPSEPINVLEFHAKDLNERDGDEFGSHFDIEEKQWIDCSPVGTAMRDIRSLIEAPADTVSLDHWQQIILRDELQVIDQFQQLDQQLRYMIVNVTGIGDKIAPKLPPWLNKHLVIFLDDTFGWSHQTSRDIWEHDHYLWLHKIIAVYKTRDVKSSKFLAWQELDRNSFEFLGYQPMPLLLRAHILGFAYVGYRMVQIGLGG